jgi:serine-type D-Ala-D-Ala carboxypeptidase/endopeptidase
MALASTVSLRAADMAEIRSIMANRVESGKAVGIVTGVIDEKGRQVVASGKISLDGTQPPDGDTVFEIGSVTKVFTSLILADMIEKGEVKPDDPVAKFLPATVKVPSRNGRQITLLDLSMQVSGLPRLPDNLKPADPANPYADYDAAKLYGFLSRYTLTRDPGEKYEYSNLAVGLLGHALALKAGMRLRRTAAPAHLRAAGNERHIHHALRGAKEAARAGIQRIAQARQELGFRRAGRLRRGALHGERYAEVRRREPGADRHPAQGRHAPHAIREERKPALPDLEIGMAWHVFTKFDTLIWWHNGGTYGYRSFVGFNPAKKEGVVVLCNTFMDNDDLGRHILESRYPVAGFTKEAPRKEIQVDAAVLERYVGEYELTPAFKIAVTREGARLFVQATGQPRFEIFAQSESEFFLKVVDASVTFLPDALILHQGGMDQKAKKVK